MSTADHLSPLQFGEKPYANNPATDEDAARASYRSMLSAKGDDVPEWSVAPTEYFEPHQLTHTQPILMKANLESLEQTKAPMAGKVIRSKGVNYIQDGHHRAHLAAQRGQQFAAQVWDVDAHA